MSSDKFFDMFSERLEKLFGLSPSWMVPALLLGACLMALGLAFLAQYVGGLAPCVLCLYQRAAYGVAGLFALLALFFAPRLMDDLVRLLVGAAGLAFVAGAGIAFFHVGVEQHWWEGTQSCTGASLGAASTVEDLRALLESAPLVRCDEIAWSLFGLSMAGYNVLASLFLAFLSFAGRGWIAAGRLPFSGQEKQKGEKK